MKSRGVRWEAYPPQDHGGSHGTLAGVLCVNLIIVGNLLSKEVHWDFIAVLKLELSSILASLHHNVFAIGCCRKP